MENNNGFIFKVSDSLEFIEDGINAARALTVCREDITGQVLTEEEHNNANEWIFDHLMNDLQELRASVSREIGLHLEKQKAE